MAVPFPKYNFDYDYEPEYQRPPGTPPALKRILFLILFLVLTWFSLPPWGGALTQRFSRRTRTPPIPTCTQL